MRYGKSKVYFGSLVVPGRRAELLDDVNPPSPGFQVPDGRVRTPGVLRIEPRALVGDEYVKVLLVTVDPDAHFPVRVPAVTMLHGVRQRFIDDKVQLVLRQGEVDTALTDLRYYILDNPVP